MHISYSTNLQTSACTYVYLYHTLASFPGMGTRPVAPPSVPGMRPATKERSTRKIEMNLYTSCIHNGNMEWNSDWNVTLTDCGNRTVANDHEIHSETVCDRSPLNPLTSDGGATDCGSDSLTTVFCSWTCMETDTLSAKN